MDEESYRHIVEYYQSDPKRRKWPEHVLVSILNTAIINVLNPVYRYFLKLI